MSMEFFTDWVWPIFVASFLVLLELFFFRWSPNQANKDRLKQKIYGFFQSLNHPDSFWEKQENLIKNYTIEGRSREEAVLLVKLGFLSGRITEIRAFVSSHSLPSEAKEVANEMLSTWDMLFFSLIDPVKRAKALFEHFQDDIVGRHFKSMVDDSMHASKIYQHLFYGDLSKHRFWDFGNSTLVSLRFNNKRPIDFQENQTPRRDGE